MYSDTQMILPVELLSDGQFVWGPNVGEFDIRSYLINRNSELYQYADDIEMWARYSSVNPKILLTILELRYGYVTRIADDIDAEEIRSVIETTSMDLAVAFYEHLHTWGERRESRDREEISINPTLLFTDGSTLQISPKHTSGTFAIAATVAISADFDTWVTTLFELNDENFLGVLGVLFPELDPLDERNDINPSIAPPDPLFQFPFPLGATWRFNGPHSWAGDNTPPFSSMDFATGTGSCESPPDMWTVASAAGTAIHPSGYDCWTEIEHSPEWTTSYYHMTNTIDPQGDYLYPNASLGQIACEICAGGYATGPHVHWTVKYNGAYVSLEGIKISGWTIHVGEEAYTTGSLERDGVTLNVWSWVENDYQTYYFHPNRSLRFYGNAVNDIDRLKIRLDTPARPVDIGETDFTIEWWMKALPGENEAPAQIPQNEIWVLGNIILDRSVTDDGNNGELGVSLQDGRIAFGVRSSVDFKSDTILGNINVTDGAWHHVAVTRSLDGWMQIFVDGQLDISELSPIGGDISYLDGHTVYDPDDPYLVIGAEKFDVDPVQRPAFHGWLDEMRFSSAVRYTSNFTPPDSAFTPDADTVALLHFDEGSGDGVNDTTGIVGGPSNGVRFYGGSPAGPEWSIDTPFEYVDPTPTPTPDPTNTPPNTPSNPIPSDTATEVSIYSNLGWDGGDPDGDPVTYDVFFEADNTSPNVLICDDVSLPACDPGNLALNTLYYWYVISDDGEDTSTGPVWSFTTDDVEPPVSNDDFDNPEIISSTPYNNSQDTTGATLTGDDPPIKCIDQQQGYNTVWYRYTPTSNGVITVDTLGSDYDTVLALWTGERGTLNRISANCNDDSNGGLQSEVSLGVSSSTTMYIEVAGKTSDDYGTLNLSLVLDPNPTIQARNGSFERDADGNGIPNSWYGKLLTGNDKRVCNQAMDGLCSFRMLGNGNRKQLKQTNLAGGAAGEEFNLSGWARSTNANDSGPFAIRMVVNYLDGTKDVFRINFNTGTHGWEHHELNFITAKPYTRMVIALLYGKAGGTVWFDDVHLDPIS